MGTFCKTYHSGYPPLQNVPLEPGQNVPGTFYKTITVRLYSSTSLSSKDFSEKFTQCRFYTDICTASQLQAQNATSKAICVFLQAHLPSLPNSTP